MVKRVRVVCKKKSATAKKKYHCTNKNSVAKGLRLWNISATALRTVLSCSLGGRPLLGALRNRYNDRADSRIIGRVAGGANIFYAENGSIFFYVTVSIAGPCTLWCEERELWICFHALMIWRVCSD